MVMHGIYETQNLLSLQLVSFLVGLRTYQRPCIHGRTIKCSSNRNTNQLMLDGEMITVCCQNCAEQGCWKVLSPTRKETSYSVRRFWCSYPIYNHNWRNISTIYTYNKTSIKRNILTIKQNTSGSRSGWGLISTPVYVRCVGKFQNSWSHIGRLNIIYENDETYQLEATIMIYSHK